MEGISETFPCNKNRAENKATKLLVQTVFLPLLTSPYLLLPPLTFLYLFLPLFFFDQTPGREILRIFTTL
jgi:hypothetical protein